LLALALLIVAWQPGAVFAAVLALAGMFVIERLWVLAPQQVPLS
jgi:hypothetical protein